MLSSLFWSYQPFHVTFRLELALYKQVLGAPTRANYHLPDSLHPERKYEVYCCKNVIGLTMITERVKANTWGKEGANIVYLTFMVYSSPLKSVLQIHFPSKIKNIVIRFGGQDNRT